MTTDLPTRINPVGKKYVLTPFFRIKPLTLQGRELPGCLPPPAAPPPPLTPPMMMDGLDEK